MFLGQDILPEENKVRELCGFSGSAGNMIVFRDKAFLFVDGRYELQAQMEVDASDIAVVCTRESLATWMQNNLAEPCTIAYDPWCHSVSEVDYWNRSLKGILLSKTAAGFWAPAFLPRNAKFLNTISALPESPWTRKFHI